MRRHLYYYTHVPHDFEAVGAILQGDASRWLPPPAEHNGRGWHVLLRAEGALPPRVAERQADVVTGPASVADDRVLVSISWQATSREQFFPVLAGDLALDRLEEGCHLSLMGAYRPPLAVVGGVADAMLGHRVAEAVVRRFVLDIADRIDEVASTEFT
jgi:hypothetical protein